MTTHSLPAPVPIPSNLLDSQAPLLPGSIADLCEEYSHDRARELLSQVFKLAVIHDTFNDQRKREDIIIFQGHLMKALDDCYALEATAPKQPVNTPMIA